MKLQYHKAQTAKGHRGGPQEIVYTEILAAIRPAEWPDYSSDSLSFISGGSSSSRSNTISSASSDSGLANPICDSSRPEAMCAVNGYLEMTSCCTPLSPI